MQKIGDIPNTRADSNGEFTDGNVAGGVPPTILPAAWFNTIQRELMSVLSAAEIDADSAQFNQVAAAISKLISNEIEGSHFLQAANHLKEIKNAGPAAVAETLVNLGLSDLVLAGVGAGSLGTTGYAEIPLVISGAKKMLLLCWGVGSTGSNGSFTQSFAKAFPTAVLCKLVTNSASTSPSGFAGASTTLSTISIYSASAAGTPSGIGVAYNYLAIGY